jgi:hypothetical protein
MIAIARVGLNASVDAKGAKEKGEGRKEEKGFPSFLSLRPWYSLFAFFASTLAFKALGQGALRLACS